jgi:hypothetical protein
MKLKKDCEISDDMVCVSCGEERKVPGDITAGHHGG